MEIRQVAFLPLPTAREVLEEQIALCSSEIEKCKREIRVGEDAQRRYRQLQLQLSRLAAEYTRAG